MAKLYLMQRQKYITDILEVQEQKNLTEQNLTGACFLHSEQARSRRSLPGEGHHQISMAWKNTLGAGPTL